MVDLTNRTILVTGGCGFIGSNFLEMVSKEYENVTIINMDKMGIGSRTLLEIPNNDKNKYTYLKCDIRYMNYLVATHEHFKFDYIFHFAAESHVDRSINSPSPFIENNVMGMVSLLEWVRNYQPQAKVINISCYDEETKALTNRGILGYKDIKIGDKVLSLNDKFVLEWKEVEKVLIQDYNGEMIHFKSSRNDLMVTPNHRMYYTDSDEQKLLFEDAESLVNHKAVKYFPRGKIEKSGNFNEKEWAKWYLFGIYIGDGCSDTQIKKSKSLSGLNRESYLKKVRDSKGHFTKNQALIGDEGYQEYVIQKGRRVFIHVPTGDKARENTEKALNILGIKWTSVQKNATYDYIYTSDKWLYDSVQCFGKRAKEKFIPDDIISELNFEQAEALFHGLIDSDGSYREDHPWVLNTSSNKLAENALFLGNMLGFSSRCSKRSSISYIDGRKIEGDSNCIYFRKNKIGINHKYSKIPYDGKVWCLKVRDNKNFITVRNGITHLSGNTDEVFGHLNVNDPAFTEESPFDPRSPYAASKASADLIANSYVTTYGLDITTTHCCNNFGKHQADEKFIPTVIRSIVRGEPIPVYGTGENIREWIHVEDHNKWLLEIASNPHCSTNIGSGIEKTNLNMIKDIGNILGLIPNIKFVEDRKGHDFRYAIESHIPFELRNHDEALKETVEFYRNKYQQD